MKKVIYYFCCLLLLHNNIQAQIEGNVWAFGNYAGFNLNSGNPVPIQTAYSAVEACASICDAHGKLLFYTDGSYIWDRTGAIMPNANNFTGVPPNIYSGMSATASTTQGAIIIPVPDSANKYYVFSLTSHFGVLIDSNMGLLFYSVVDMNLNGGLGDIEPGRKGIPMDNHLTEKMTATRGSCPNTVWLVTHSDTSRDFRSYEITNKGLNTKPVISAAGMFAPPMYRPDWVNGNNPYKEGAMIFSPDGSKLAIRAAGVGLDSAGRSYFVGEELFDFDKVTGIVSNGIPIDSTPFFSLCFSPDGSKLYACSGGNYMVRQYDVSLPTAAAIQSSQQDIISPEAYIGYMKLGPDGKIYFLNYDYGALEPTWYGHSGIGDPNYVNVINFPNLAGVASKPVMNAIKLLPGTSTHLMYGLPNVVIIPHEDTIFTSRDTFVCSPDYALIADTTRPVYNYLWDNGVTGPKRNITDFGTYTVTYLDKCTRYIDTFHVKKHSFDYAAVSGNSDCLGQYRAWVTLPANNAGVFSFTWIDAGSNIVRQSQSSSTDTIIGLNASAYSVQVKTPQGCDTVLGFNLQPSTPPDTGAFGGCISDSRLGKVWVVPIDTVTYTYYWRNYAGIRLAQYDSSHNKGDTISATQQGIYMVHISGPNNCIADFSISVPIPDAGPLLTDITPSQIIKPGSSLELNAAGALHYIWSPDSGTLSNPNIFNPIATPKDSITYVVTGTDTMGCSSSAIVHLDLDYIPFIPSAFTPNGDGENDVFRILNIKYNRLLEFKVFNRWGKLLFSTKNVDQGWDGSSNGVPQDIGTYSYIISVAQQGGKERLYKGNVTLVR